MQLTKPTREQIEEQAAALFDQLGFAGTSIKTICEKIGIRPASLYFHFPGGKEQVFLAVVARLAQNYRSTIDDALATTHSLESALTVIGEKFINLPPMSMRILTERDLPLLSPKARTTVSDILMRELFGPLRLVFERYSGTLHSSLRVDFLIGTWVTLLDSIRIGHRMSGLSPKDVLGAYVQIFIHGALETVRVPEVRGLSSTWEPNLILKN